MPRACLEFPSGTGMNNWRCIGLMQRCSSLFCFPPQIPCDHIMKTLSVLLPEVLIAQIEAQSRRRQLSKSEVVRERLTRANKSPRRQPVLRDAVAEQAEKESISRQAAMATSADVDADFRIYRRHDPRMFPCVLPGEAGSPVGTG